MRTIVWLIVFSPAAILAQSRNDPGALFVDDDVLEVVLTTDLSSLLADIENEQEEHPALITYQAGDNPLSVPVQVKTRGNFRRRPENCNFPPLRLNFAGKTSDATLFEGQDKVKLVTHCQSDDPAYEQYIIQEYLVYSVYNLLTDASFRVRLLEITYRDATGKHKDFTRQGFLIEDKEAMAARSEVALFDLEDSESSTLDYDQSTLLHLFEYMIGNIDWSVPIHHNLLLMGTSPDAPLTPVPYDFDHAGVIGADYADKTPGIGTASLRYQIFRDFCRTDQELRPVFDLFNERRDQIYALYENLEVLEKTERRRALRYYDRFFREINDPEAIEKTFISPCQRHAGTLK